MAFTLKDVSAIIGINYNRCRQWVGMGFIKPSIKESKPKGSANQPYGSLSVCNSETFTWEGMVKGGQW